jgi:hypothetical protein
MHRTFGRIALALPILLCFGCTNPTRFAESLVPKEEDEFARHCLELVRTRDYEPIFSAMDPSVDVRRATLENMSDTIGTEAPLSVTLLGSHVLTMSDLRRVTLTYELELPDSWVVVTLVLTSQGDDQTISSFRLRQIPDSLENLNSLTFNNAGAFHYVFLLLAAAVPLFIVFAAILLFRTKIKRKWLWLIFILLGFGEFIFNWTSGGIGFRPLAVVLLGASMTRAGLYAPWIIKVTFPIGAAVFLVKRRSIRRTGKMVENSEPGELDVGKEA